MKNFKTAQLLFMVLCFITASCQNKPGPTVQEAEKTIQQLKIDSTDIDAFFKSYVQFAPYGQQVEELYIKHNNNYIWFDHTSLTEFAQIVNSQVNNINDEGLQIKLPYKTEFESIFSDSNVKPDAQKDILISAVYIYYITRVYGGLDIAHSEQTGWYLPREKMSYGVYLDSVANAPVLFSSKRRFGQYYNLKKALKKYRDIEAKGGWGTIFLESNIKALKPGDTAAAIVQVRKRLYAEGYLSNDSGSAVFDDELAAGVTTYKAKHNRQTDTAITQALVKEWNIPVSERIKTISVNMERCRWISPKISAAKEFIAVNIPSFRLHYIRDKKPVLVSNVVVGKEANKTVVFNGEMSYIAFSPYWNVPNSILQNEILPAIKKNPAYLAQHNMEWNGNRVRQKPGGSNSLGLVKFMFPNSNNIYLHDTPAKTLFSRDERAFSHGCIRVEKARDLAVAITAKDGNWTEKQVDAAMNKGAENIYRLKQRIPVYIGYFTAWADESGSTAFYEDIYKRDDKLAGLLFEL